MNGLAPNFPEPSGPMGLVADIDAYITKIEAENELLRRKIAALKSELDRG